MRVNLIDRAVGFFSPVKGAERMRARATMSAMQSYDAAGRSNRTKGYKAPSGDSNSAIRGGQRLRFIARDMVRNNAIARRAVASLTDSIVGDGIIPSVEAEKDEDKRRLEDLLLSHFDTTSVDAAGRLNLYGLQRVAVQSMVTDGECLWRRRPRRPSDTFAAMPFQVECLEADHFDDRDIGRLQSGNLRAEGIEFDLLRRRVAYQLFREHPGDTALGIEDSRRVLASEILHLYRLDRPGLRRGASWLAPVIPLLTDAYDYADAQLVRQKIAAMWVAFTRDTMSDPGDQEDFDKITLKPGMFEHLPPGREVQFSDPPKVDGYADHMKQVQRMIAAGLGITYEELSGDLEGVNFSSARIGRVAMKKAITSAQWTTVMPVLCDGMNVWIKQALDVMPQAVVSGEYKIKWTPPRVEMTDPAREITAAVQEIDAGLTSKQRKIREMGYDPEEIYREIEEDRARMPDAVMAPDPETDFGE